MTSKDQIRQAKEDTTAAELGFIKAASHDILANTILYRYSDSKDEFISYGNLDGGIIKKINRDGKEQIQNYLIKDGKEFFLDIWTTSIYLPTGGYQLYIKKPKNSTMKQVLGKQIIEEKAPVPEIKPPINPGVSPVTPKKTLDSLVKDFPIGKEIKFKRSSLEGHHGLVTSIISGKVVGFGIQVEGKDSYGSKWNPEFVRIDDVIKPPSYNYQLQEDPDGKKYALINGLPVNLTPKVGGRRKTKSKSRKSRKSTRKSRK